MDTFEDHYDEGKDPSLCWHKRAYGINDCPDCRLENLQNKADRMKKALETILDINTNGHQRGMPGWEMYERINKECTDALETIPDP